MKKEDLLDFLNEKQQNTIKDYIYLDSTNIKKIPIKKGDYIKFMYKYNYQFMEGGIVIDTTEWPIVRLKSYDIEMKTFYKIDLSKVYIFYKKSGKVSRRDFFEELLDNLDKNKLKKS